MKLYVVLKESIPLGIAVNSAMHGILKAHREWEKNPDYQNWLQNHWFKVTCVANDKEFEALKKIPDHIVITESLLGQQETVLVFLPREEVPKGLKFLRLLK